MFMVQDTWDDAPKIKVIKNPDELPFIKLNRGRLYLTTDYEEYFECEETVWRPKTTLKRHSEVN